MSTQHIQNATILQFLRRHSGNNQKGNAGMQNADPSSHPAAHSSQWFSLEGPGDSHGPSGHVRSGCVSPQNGYLFTRKTFKLKITFEQEITKINSLTA